ncbi:MAG: redoxin domain-containing protein [Candidatus Dormibacteria bacterium]
MTETLAAGIEVGQEAPDFSLVDDQGEKWTLSEKRGKKVLLVFYPLSFSGTCTKELRTLRDRAADLDDGATEVVGISVDSRYVQAAFKRDENLSATLLADFNPRGAVGSLYGVHVDKLGIHARGSFVIDKEGKVADKVVGELGDERDVEGYIAALRNCPV